MLILTTTMSSFASEPRERRLRLPEAAVDQDFAPPQPESRPGTRKIREIPANADVAQLVEHFTRNEGVPGSSPGVGSHKAPLRRGFFFAPVSGVTGRLGVFGKVLALGQGASVPGARRVRHRRGEQRRGRHRPLPRRVRRSSSTTSWPGRATLAMQHHPPVWMMLRRCLTSSSISRVDIVAGVRATIFQNIIDIFHGAKRATR
jgi:hypothetical protein